MIINERAKIIDQFRNRIRNNVRKKLSKDDLTGLIDEFIDQLCLLKSRQKIQVLCEAEIKLLEEGYPQPSVSKYLAQYRKAIAMAIEDGRLAMTKATSHRYVHEQRVTGVREERLEHWALTYLKYSQEDYEAFDSRSQVQETAGEAIALDESDEIPAMNLVMRPMPERTYLDPYLALLRQFLNKKDKFATRWLATAITALTGLRFSDVIAQGSFSLTSHSYVLRVDDPTQNKDGYDILTLFPASDVLPAIERFRGLPEIRAIASLQGAKLLSAISDFNQKLNSVCGRALMQAVPPLNHKKTVSVNDLRGLYAAIAIRFFCHYSMRVNVFANRWLNHVADAPAADLFDPCNEHGYSLYKGTLLDEVEPLPFDGFSIVARNVEKEFLKETEKRAIKENPQEIPSDWILVVDRRLESLRNEFEARLQEVKQESNVGWFVRKVEGLERENLTLRLERDKAIALHGDGDELDRLKRENDRLVTELRLAQDKLNGFRLLLNGGDRSEHADVEVKATAKAIAPVKGRAFKRAEAIVQGMKEWNRLNPSESFAISPGVLETFFRVHRQATKEYFEVYQGEIDRYHLEIGVDSLRWHNRGKDAEALKAFVLEWVKG